MKPWMLPAELRNRRRRQLRHVWARQQRSLSKRIERALNHLERTQPERAFLYLLGVARRQLMPHGSV